MDGRSILRPDFVFWTKKGTKEELICTKYILPGILNILTI